MKAWTKGGLIGLIIYLIISLISFALPKGEFGNMGILLIMILTVPITIISNLFNPPLLTATCGYGYVHCLLRISIIKNILIYAAYFFIIGALIGWLIGRLKK